MAAAKGIIGYRGISGNMIERTIILFIFVNSIFCLFVV